MAGKTKLFMKRKGKNFLHLLHCENTTNMTNEKCVSVNCENLLFRLKIRPA